MGLTEPGDERTVIAAANELNNIMNYRGLSLDQSVQALIAASSAFLLVASNDNEELLESNVKMFCRQIRMRTRGVLKNPPNGG